MCPPKNPPREPVATATANRTLNAVGRLRSSTTFATAGATQTTQPHNITPSKNANATCPGYQNIKTLAAKAADINSRQEISTFLSPKRCATIPIGIVPAMLPKAMAPASTPNDCSLKPRSSMKRLYRKKKTDTPKLKRKAAITSAQNSPRGAVSVHQWFNRAGMLKR